MADDDDDDRRPPAASAWTMTTVSASSSRTAGTSRGAPRARRRAPVVAVLVVAAVLLGGLGAAGPPTPVTTAEVLPPPDTSAFGATGRLPDVGPSPLPSPGGTPPLAGSPVPDPDAVGGDALGIPETVLAAYRAAATTLDRTAPGCRLTWPLVAGVGKVESGHAAGGAVDADGTTRRPILGPELTGTDGNAAIPDTDRGALDHDAAWDRAVGPTQFIPSSWRTFGADGNGDGRADPDNVFDAGLATARYLCSGGGDLSLASARHDAVFRYNHSEVYVATVLRWADAYASGALPVPDSTGSGVGDRGSALADGGLADGGVVDGTPTLAALPSPSPSARIGAAAAPMITSSGATRPTIAATRSPSSDLAPGAARPAPMASSGPSSTPASATTSTPPGPAAAALPGVQTPTPISATPTSATPTSATSTSATSTSSTSTSATSTSATSTSTGSTSPTSPSTGSTAPSPASSSAPRPPSTPPPAKPAPAPPAKPAPAKPAPSSTTSSSTTSSSTTSSSTAPSTTPTPAARCTAALPALAQASGVPAAQLVAASTAGPGAGRTTCTVRGLRGPLLVAVTAAPGAAAPSAPSAGLSRTVAAGRTVLTVPTTAGLPDDRARAVLAAAAAAWV